MIMNRFAIQEVLRQEGLTHTALCVHASYRSFGQVEGGPSAIIEALLAEGNTVMVPTFSGSMRVPPPEGVALPLHNGTDYAQPEYDEHTNVYDPQSNVLDASSMGAIPAAVLTMPGRIRGNHPTNSFSAVGPAAGQLIEGQTEEAIWAPLEALVRANGTVALMGIGYDRMTLLHLAEARLGRPTFIRWVNDGQGGKRAVSAGTCSLGFGKLAPVLEPYVRRVQAGSSLWTLCPAAPVLEAVMRAITENPEATRCSKPDCIRCRDIALGGPTYPTD